MLSAPGEQRPERFGELERKYDVDGGFLLPEDRLRSLPGVDDIAAARHRLDATYYDTPDRRLLAARLTLRRRDGGDDAGWHLKRPASDAKGRPVEGREELRLPLGVAGEVPGQLADLVAAQARGRPLQPVVRLVTDRAVTHLLGAGGRELAEVAVDGVVARRLQSGDGANSETSWREVEVELAEGDPGVLGAVESVLLLAGARAATHGSKLARALGELPAPPAAAVELPRGAPAGAVVGAYLASEVAQLLRQDPRVRLDEYDSVHRMRVATRRLRSTLGTYAALFQGDDPAALEHDLRQLAALLGAARDAEVLLERLRGELAALPAELVVGSARERLDGALLPGLERARDQVLAELRNPGYLALLERLVGFAGAPPLSPLAAAPAEMVLPPLVRRSWKRLAKRVRRAGAARKPAARETALHQARKAAKRLRYAAEALLAVWGEEAAGTAAQAEAVQEVLGEHQDSVVAQGVLRGLAVEAQQAGDGATFTFGALAGIEHARAERAREAFAATWRQARRRRHRRWLQPARAVALVADACAGDEGGAGQPPP